MLFEQLTQKDIDIFCDYVTEYAPSEGAEIYQNIGDPKDILHHWNKEKETLFKAFGNRFILEKPVEFNMPESVLSRNMSHAINYGALRPFIDKFKTELHKIFGWEDPYYFITRLCEARCLANNEFNNAPNNYTISFPTGESVKLVKGAKTMKLMRKIAKILNLEQDFEEFRIQHSLILNQKKLKGTLCLSIHPMDYITMSDNGGSWSSCMSWTGDGDYRAGTVEMMNSHNVIVAYLKSDNENFKWDTEELCWNHKLWRTLIVADEKVICSVKNYPYHSEDLTKACVEWVRDLVIQNLNWNFPYPLTEIKEYELFEHQGKSICVDFQTDRMYNDFGSTIHYGFISETLQNMNHRETIFYSGILSCMFCGSTNCLDSSSNYVLCSNCSSCDEDCYYYCEECGARIYEEDVYWVDGNAICSSCFDNIAGECELSNEYYYDEDLIRIYLARKEGVPTFEDTSITVHRRYLEACYYEPCYWTSTYFSCKPHRSNFNNIYYWNIEDVSDAGARNYFCIYDKDEYISET